MNTLLFPLFCVFVYASLSHRRDRHRRVDDSDGVEVERGEPSSTLTEFCDPQFWVKLNMTLQCTRMSPPLWWYHVYTRTTSPVRSSSSRKVTVSKVRVGVILSENFYVCLCEPTHFGTSSLPRGHRIKRCRVLSTGTDRSRFRTDPSCLQT